MSICIAPIHETSLRRSGIAPIVKGYHSLPAHPAFHLQSEWAIPAFAFPATAGKANRQALQKLGTVSWSRPMLDALLWKWLTDNYVRLLVMISVCGRSGRQSSTVHQRVCVVTSTACWPRPLPCTVWASYLRRRRGTAALISRSLCLHVCGDVPRVGSGVVRIDLLHFLAGCRKRRRNQVLSIS